jgi:hypothetical protein
VVNEIHATGRHYDSNLTKIKAGSLPSKIPVQNWYYLSKLNYSGEIQNLF